MTKKRKTIKCHNCGVEHYESLANCCWIQCSCGKMICGRCGYAEIREIAIVENGVRMLDKSAGSDDNYWCCEVCSHCGLQGCGMCI